MKLIVGLGNPGEKYQHTRHNAGFSVIETVQSMLDFPKFSKKTKLFSEISEGEIKDEKVILAKPQTFMNHSGKAVAALLKFYKISPQDLWVVYDDIDLIEGTFRIREEGSAGTHNGMRSIVTTLGHGNFPRFRVGIAKEKMHDDIVKFILTPLRGTAWKCFESPVKVMGEVIVFTLKEDLKKTMDTYN